MNEDEKSKYLKELMAHLEACLADPGQKHGLLIISNSENAVLSLYSINADEPMIQNLIAAAAHVVFPPPEMQVHKTIN